VKLNHRHISALDDALQNFSAARSLCKNPERVGEMGLVINRLRQLRILLIEACIQPTLNFTDLFHVGIPDDSDLVKGIRSLTGHAEDEDF